jgi:hypothetical protein
MEDSSTLSESEEGMTAWLVAVLSAGLGFAYGAWQRARRVAAGKAVSTLRVQLASEVAERAVADARGNALVTYWQTQALKAEARIHEMEDPDYLRAHLRELLSFSPPDPVTGRVPGATATEPGSPGSGSVPAELGALPGPGGSDSAHEGP